MSMAATKHTWLAVCQQVRALSSQQNLCVMHRTIQDLVRDAHDVQVLADVRKANFSGFTTGSVFLRFRPRRRLCCSG